MSKCCGPNGRAQARPMQQGKDGDDAFTVWRNKQPEGADISWDAYMVAITGTDGESAYQVWVAQQPEGADISLDAFLAFMEGREGPPGPAGPIIQEYIQAIAMASGGQPGNTPSSVTIGSPTSSQLIRFNALIPRVIDPSKPVNVKIKEILAYQNGAVLNICNVQTMINSIATLLGVTTVNFSVIVTPVFSHKIDPAGNLIPISVWTGSTNMTAAITYYEAL